MSFWADEGGKLHVHSGPLEPCFAVAPMSAAPDGGHTVVRSLSLADSPSSPSGIDEQLYELAHDMRQPVASIIVLAEAVLTEAAIPAAARMRLAQIVDQAEWLGDMLSQVLEPSTEGTPDRAYDLTSIASEAAQAEQLTYQGDLDVQRNRRDMCVRGNRIELRRVIANLLSNATRAAGPEGRVVVQLRRTGDRVVLTVDDTGPGFGLIRRGAGLGLRVIARSLNGCRGHIEYGRSRMGGAQAVLALRAFDD